MKANTDSKAPIKHLGPIVFLAFVVIGAIAFLLGLTGDHPGRAWQAYLINFLMWSAVSQGALLFAVVMHLTRASWSGPLSDLSQAFSAFFPVSFVLFVILFLGRAHVFPWLNEDLHGKEVWLNIPFLFTRDAAALIILYGLGIAFLHQNLQAKAIDRGVASGRPRTGLRAFMISPKGKRPTAEQIQHRLTVISVLYAIAYALVLSLLGYDLVMAMDPHWVSTLFGAYCFVKAFYIGLGALIILAAVHYITRGEESGLKPSHFHDVGKLFLGFCLVWADFFYVHLVVIWYGNIPEETHYMIERTMHPPWQPLAWVILVVCFVAPFLIMLSKKIKTKPASMIVLSAVILAGIWLEHLLLVGPPMNHGALALPLGFSDALITMGFVGLMVLALWYFMDTFPELTPTGGGEAN